MIRTPPAVWDLYGTVLLAVLFTHSRIRALDRSLLDLIYKLLARSRCSLRFFSSSTGAQPVYLTRTLLLAALEGAHITQTHAHRKSWGRSVLHYTTPHQVPRFSRHKTALLFRSLALGLLCFRFSPATDHSGKTGRSSGEDRCATR
uniref:Putative secreted peptide n=1 Tax=Anopheles braziliensis TaxID=58242 RepID=A0A2M3ZMK1_9DIPT